MILNRNFQTIVNIMVLMLFLGFVILGALFALPARSPFGPLMGKLMSSKSLLSGIIASLDPAELAKALNDNPEFTKELIAQLQAEDIAAAVNANEEFITELVVYLDPQVIANIANESSTLVNNVIQYLDPQVVADIVNNNSEFVNKVVKYLSTLNIADIVNNNETFVTEIVSYVDPAVVANIINNNPTFITEVAGEINADVLARAINDNPQLLVDVVARLNPQVVALAVNQNGAFLSNLLGVLNPSVLAQAANNNGQFISDLLGYLDPAVIAETLNNNPTFINEVAMRLNPEFIASIINNQSFTTAVLGFLSPSSLAGSVNANGAFVSDIMGYIDPNMVAGAVEDNVPWMNSLIGSLDGNMLGGIMDGNSAFLSDFVGAMSTDTVADIVNGNQLWVTDLVTKLDTDVIAGVTNAPTTTAFVSELIGKLDGTTLGHIMDNNSAFLTDFVGAMSTDTVADIVNDNQLWVTDLVTKLDTDVMAGVANDPGTLSFLNELIGKLDGAAIGTIMDANSLFLTDFVGALSPTTIADVVNDNGDWMVDVVDNLDSSVISGIANDPVTIAFLNQVLPSLDENALVGILNTNWDWMGDLVSVVPAGTLNSLLGDVSAWLTGTIMPGLDENVIASMANDPASMAFLNRLVPLIDENALMSLLNTNWDWAGDFISAMPSVTLNNLLNDVTPWVTGTVMPGLDENAIAGIANDPATITFLNTLIPLLDENALMDIFNLNWDWIGDFISATPSGTINNLINDITPWITGTLMTGLNPTVIAGIANDANTISFLNALLPQLDAAALAGIVDGNGAWMADLVSGISPATVNTMINDLTPWVTGTLMPGLNTANIAAIANNPATINFINALLPQLNAASMAGVVNTNWGWLDDVVAAVAPGTVNNMVSDLSPWITGTLLPGLNTANIAGIANNPATINFINALLPQLNAASMAGVVNTNWGWLDDVVAAVAPGTVNNMVSDLTPWITGTLMPGLNTANIAAIANDPATINLVNALLPQLNAASMAGVVNTNWGWLDDVVAAVAPGTVNNMINDLSPWITGTLLPALDTGAIAGIANNAATINFINALLPQLNAASMAGVVNTNWGWLDDVVAAVAPGTVNNMVSDLTPWITGTLLPGLNTANIAAIANDAATLTFINALLPQLNAASMASIVNTNVAWLNSVVTNITPATVNTMIAGLTPWITGTLMPGLDRNAVASIANNANTVDFISDLLPLLDEVALAAIVNNNGAWIGDFTSQITPATVNALMAQLYANGWIATLMGGLNRGTVASIANDPATVDFISDLLPLLDEVALAAIVNNNGAWIGDFTSQITPATVNALMAQLYANGWIATLMGGLNRGTMASIANDPATVDFISDLLPLLDEVALADIVNNNGGWISDFTMQIDVATVNTILNNVDTWVTGTLLPGLDTAAVAGIANDPATITFLNTLLPQLNAASMASIVNTNVAWLNSVVTNITPATVNTMIAGLTPWITGTLLPGLNTANIAAIVNDAATLTFINALLPQLNAASMASIVNTNVAWLNSVVTNITPATVNTMIAGLTPWITGTLMPGLDRNAVASIANNANTVDFISDLLPLLDEVALAAIVNNNGAWIGDFTSQITPATVNALMAQLYANGWIATLMGGLNRGTVASIANDPATVDFISDLLPLLDEVALADIVNNNGGWISDFTMQIDVATVNTILNNVDTWVTGTLLPGLDTAAVAGIANDPATITFLNTLLPLLNAASMASIVNTNVAWLNSVVTNITPATVNTMIAGLTPWITGTLLPGLNTANIAAIVNDAATLTFINALLPQLNAASMASIVNTNVAWLNSVVTNITPATVNTMIAGLTPWITGTLMPGLDRNAVASIANNANTVDFISDLLPLLDEVALAAIVNNNGAWIGDFTSQITPATVNALMAQLYANGWIATLMGGLNRGTVASIANDPATVDFISDLLPLLDEVALAAIVNNNGAWIGDFTSQITPATVNALMAQLYANGWIATLMGGLNRGTMASIANDPATVDFISDLLPLLDEVALADIVNNNGGWISDFTMQIDVATVNTILNNVDTWVTGTLLPGLDTAAVAGIANDPATITFLNTLLPQLNAASMASIVNTNVAWLNSVVTNITPATVNTMIAGLTPWITGTLLPGLNTANIAAIANDAATLTFINALLPQLNAASMASIVNTNVAWLNSVVTNITPATVNTMIAGLTPWITGTLMPGLDRNAVASIANNANTVDFISDLLPLLDEVALAAIVNNNGAWIGDFTSQITPATVNALMAQLYANGWIATLMGGLNRGTVASIANDPATVDFISDLLPLLDEVALAAIVNNNVTWISDFAQQVTPATVNGLIANTAGWLAGTIIPGIVASPATVTAIAGIVNDADTIALLNALLPQLNAASMASIVNTNVAWLNSVVTNITPATVNNMISGLSAYLTGTLIPGLNTANIAAIANDPATLAFINALLPQLTPANISAIVNTNWNWMGDVVSGLSPAAINALLVDIGPWFLGTLMDPVTGLNEAIIAGLVNHPNTVQFISDLLPLLDEVALAAIVNNNGAWIGDFTSQITPATVNALMAQLYANGWIATLMGGLNRGTVASIANDPATVDFISDLLPLLDEVALAAIVNNNGAWIGDFTSQITPATVNALMAQLYANGWIATLMGGLNRGTMAAIANDPATVDFISDLLPLLDEVALADIVNNNGGWISDFTMQIDVATVNTILNNVDTWVTGTLLPGLDTAAVAGIANDPATITFLNTLLPQLNAASMASIVNTNVAWLNSVVTNITPATVNTMIAGLTPWITGTLLPGLNTANIAAIVNDAATLTFINALLPQLNAASMASIVNTNVAWLNSVVTNITPATVNTMIAGLTPWITGTLMPGLDRNAVASIANNANTVDFISDLLPLLDEVALAAIVNNNGAWIGDFTSQITPATVNALMAQLYANGWIATLMGGLNRGTVASIANDPATVDFISDLLPLLDEVALAAIVNNNGAWIGDFTSQITPATVNALMAQLYANGWIATLMGGLNRGTMAAIANDPATVDFISDLLPLLDEVALADIVKNNGGWISDFTMQIDVATVNTILNNVDTWVTGTLLPGLDTAAVAGIANDPATITFLNTLLPQLNAASMASIVNTNVGWLNSVVTNITPATVNTMIAGLTPWITGTLLPGLNTANIAAIANDAATLTFINALLPQLNAASMASIVNTNVAWLNSVVTNITPATVNTMIAGLTPWITGTLMPGLDRNAVASIANNANTVDFISDLLPLLDEVALAAIVNNNGAWIGDFTSQITPATVNALMAQLYANGWIATLMGGLNRGTVASIANDPATVDFISDLLPLLDEVALAAIVNNNGAWIGDFTSQITPATVNALMAQLYANGWIATLMGGLNRGTMAAIANDPATVDFISDLLPLLDEVALADIVNNNGGWISDFTMQIDVATVNTILNNVDTWVTGTLLPGLDTAAVAGIANDPATITFLNTLLPLLNAASMASIVNTNVGWLNSVVTNITPATVNTMIAGLTPWITGTLLPGLNTANIAAIANDAATLTFINALLPQLNAASMASIVNTNVAWLNSVVTNITPATVNTMIAGLTPWITGTLMPGLDRNAVASIANNANTVDFISDLLPLLDEVALAAIVNNNGAWIGDFTSQITPATVNALMAQLYANGWIATLMGGLNRGTVASIANDPATVDFISDLLPLLDEVALAAIVNNNGAWIGDFTSQITPATVNALMAQLYANGWIATLMGGLNRGTMAAIANDPATVDFISDLLPLLDEVALADIVNNNGGWISDFTMQIDVATVNTILNNVDTWVTGTLLPGLDTAAVAGIANDPATITFLNTLLPLLNAASMASIVNTNVGWLNSVVTNITPATVNTMIAGLTPWITGTLLPGLNTANIAAIANDAATLTFINALLPQLNAASMASIVNTNVAWLNSVVTNITPATVNTMIAGLTPWITGTLMPGLDRNAVASIANNANTVDFISDLLPLLDEVALAAIVNNNGAWIGDFTSQITPATVNALMAQLYANGWIATLMGGLNRGTVASIANDPATVDFISDLLPLLDEVALAAIVNNNVTWISDFAQQVTPATVNGLIANTAGWLAGTIIPGIVASPATVTAIAGIVNDADTIALLNALLPQLNAASMASIVNTNVAWLNSVVTNITPATVNTMIAGLTPWITGTLLPGLNTANIAAIVNDPATLAFINALLPQLTPANISAIVNTNWNWMGDVVSGLSPAAINALLVDIGPWFLGTLMDPVTGLNEAIIAGLVNHPNTVQFITDLLPLLNPASMASIVNTDWAWLNSVVANITPATVNNMISGLSAYLTGTLIPGLDTANIAAIVNDAATVDFITDLLPLLNAASMASIVNTDWAWLNSVVANVTPATVNNMISGLSAYLTGTLIPGLNTANIAAIANDPATLAFINALLPQLTPANISAIVNTNWNWMGDVVSGLSPAAINALLVDIGPWFLGTLMDPVTGLNEAIIAGLVNHPNTVQFITDLLPLLNAASMASVVNTDWAWLDDVVAAVNPATVNNMVSDLTPWITGTLLPGLNTANIATIANDAATITFLNALLPQLNAASMASIVNTNVAWINSVVTNITPATVNTMIAGLTGWLTGTLIPGLNTANIAAIVNDPATLAFINALLPQLTPANISAIVNTNWNWMGDVVSGLSPAAINALLVDIGPWFLGTLMDPATGLNEAIIAGLVNHPNTVQFITDLLPLLNPASMASVVNTDWAWLNSVVANITPATVNNMISGLSAYLTGTLIPGLNTANIAAIANHANTIAFLNALLPQLDEVALAGVVNSNGAWIGQLVSNLNTQTVVDIVDEIDSAWMVQLMTDMDNPTTLGNLGTLLNNAAFTNFVNDLILELDPAIMAGIANTNGAWIGQLVSNLNTQTVVNIVDELDAAWMVNLMTDMNNPTTLGTLGTLLNNAAFTSFVNNLILQLDPTIMAGIANTNGAWIGQLVSSLNTQTVVDIVDELDAAWMVNLMTDMNNPTTLGTLGTLLNNAAFTSFVNNLILQLDPTIMAGIANTNGAWIGQLVSSLNTQTVVDIVDELDAAWMVNLMTDMNNPTTLGTLGTLLNNAAFTSFVNNLILQLDPTIMAGIANTNGAWIGQLVSSLNTQTVVDIVDELDAAWMVQLMTDMDNPTTLGTLGALLNNAAFTNFTNDLILQLNPAIMAGIANTNGTWIGQLVSNLNTSMVVDVVNALDSAWMVNLMTDMNNPTTLGNLGALLNNAAFTAFTNNLILQLNPAIMAGIANTNGTWIGQLVSNLNTSMVVDVVNALDSAWMVNLMTDMNNPTTLGNLGALLNNAAFTAFTNNLILQLNPAIMAGIANTNGTWIGQLVSNLNTSMVVDVVNALDSAWMIQLMTDMDNPTTLTNLATMLNDAAFTNFVNDLILQLDPVAIAGIANTNGTWIGDVISALNTSTVVDIVNSIDLGWYGNLMDDLRVNALAQLANMVNAPQTTALVNALLPLLTPASIASIVNTNVAWLNSVVTNITPATVNTMISGLTPWLTGTLIPGLNTANIAAIVNDPATLTFINALLPQLTPANISAIVNTNWNWMGDVVSGLSPAAINALLVDIGPWFLGTLMDPATGLNEAIIAGLVNHPNTVQFITDLLPLLDAPSMASIVNTNVAWLNSVVTNVTPATVNDMISGLSGWLTGTLIPGLNTANIAAIANDAATITFLNALLPQLNAASMASVVNTNATWLASVATNISPATANTLIANTASWLTDTLIPGITPASITTLAGVVNDADTVALINALLPQLNAGSMASIVNNNVAWLNSVVTNVTPATVNSMISGLTPYLTGTLIPGLNTANLATLINDPATVNLINTLLPQLSAAMLASLINNNAAWVSSLLTSITPATVNTIIANTQNWLRDSIIPGIVASPATVTSLAGTVNDADTIALINALLPQLNAASMASIVNSNVAWLNSVVTNITPATVNNMISGLTNYLTTTLIPGLSAANVAAIANHANTITFLNTLLPLLNAGSMASIVNTNWSWLDSVVTNITPATVNNMINGLTPYLTTTLFPALNTDYLATIANHANTITLINTLLPKLNAASMASIVNTNWAWLDSVVANITPATVNSMISGLTPYLTGTLIPGLNTANIAVIANHANTTAFINALLPQLNPASIASIVNSNVNWLNSVVTNITPATVNTMISGLTAWLTGTLIPGLNTANIATLINHPNTLTFINTLLPQLNATNMASIVNTNWAWLNSVVSSITPATVNNMINGLTGWLTGTLMPGLNTANVATIINHPNTLAFINALLPQLNATNMASIVNTNWAWLNSVVTGITPATVNNMINGLTGWLTGTLIPGLNSANVATIVNHANTLTFINALLPQLNATNIASIVNSNVAWLNSVVTNVTPATVNGMISGLTNYLTTTLIPGLDTAGIAAIANHANTIALINALMPQLSSTMANTTIAGLVNRTDGGLMNLLNTTNIANMVNDARTTSFINTLLPLLNTASLAGVVNSNGAFLSSLIGNLNAATLAGAVNGNGAFITNLITNLNGATGTAAATGINGNAALLQALIDGINPTVVATAINTNSALGVGNTLLEQLVAGLNADTATAAARGINSNQPFLEALISALDVTVLADAINNNSAFIIGLIANLDPLVLANVVNNIPQASLNTLIGALNPTLLANAINANGAFLNSLVPLLNPGVLAAAINSMPQASLNALIGGLNANLLATAINSNQAWLTSLVGLLSPTVMGGVINSNTTFLTNMIGAGALAPGTLATVLNSANGQTFLTSLIPSLDTTMLANVLNTNATRDWLTALIGKLTASQIAYVLNNNQAFLTNLIGALSPTVLAAAINANGTFLTNLIANLNAATVAAAINANGTFLTNLIANLNATTLAGAINANPTFLGNLIAGLNTDTLAGVLTGAQGSTFLTSLFNELSTAGGHSARGQALVNALMATGIDADNNTDPISFFDSLILGIHSDLNVLGLGHHINGKIEALKWDANGGDPY